MRICYFTPNFLPQVGGTEVVTDALARQFHEAGHDVVVLARGDGRGVSVPYPVEWYREPVLRRWFPERVSKALRACHRRHGFDVFLVNYAHPTGYAAVRLSAEVGVPVVLVSHGGDLFVQGKDRLRPHIWKRTQFAYRHADGLVAISPYLAGLIREIVPHPARMELIPNGVDLEELRMPADRPADFGSDRPFCLCLGNLIDQKGFSDAVAAFAQAREHLGGLMMVVVGDGRLRESLRRQAERAGVGEDMAFMGRRVGADKRWFLQNCRFGVMPSLEEGHPIVGLEYLAVGKGVVCTTIEAFDGMFEDGLNSVRIPVHRPVELAGALVSMNEGALERMGRESLRRSQSYAWPNVARRYLSFMQTVCEKGS